MDQATRGFWADKKNIAELKRLHKKNLTATQIAKALRISSGSVSGKIRTLKLKNDRSSGTMKERLAQRSEPREERKIYQTPSLPYIPPSRFFPCS
jgi:hypothetical protein